MNRHKGMRAAWRLRFERIAYRWLSLERQEMLFRWLPARSAAMHRQYPAPTTTVRFNRTVPVEFLSVPGIRRDPQAEQEAATAEPLRNLFERWPEAQEHVHRASWRTFLRIGPMIRETRQRVMALNARGPKASKKAMDPVELTAAVRERAHALGIPLVGVAQYDEKYAFLPNRGKEVGDRVVVCFVEQDFEATQQVPSAASYHAAFSTVTEVYYRTELLTEYIRSLGYNARLNNTDDQGIVIHYAVESGLGQLGMNGQLLTPEFGSRCRPCSISTDAPLILDTPVDFGITKFCDQCRLCVKRCPSGAIPARRSMYRGVEKTKIDPARCVPVVATAQGCAVCMKVCPVQRYGLDACYDEWERSGTVLGKGTDELEGYWFDGEFMPAGRRPKLPPTWLELSPRVYASPPRSPRSNP